MFSIFIAYVIEGWSKDVVFKSAVTVISGFITYKIVFAILFHVDNKRKYTKRMTGKINFHIFKQVLIKMLVASSVFDIINNMTRFILLVEFLKLHYSGAQAAAMSSIISSSIAYVTINVIVKFIGVFGTKK